MTYELSEVANVNATRESVKIVANSLSSAKRQASKLQMFQNTFLYLRNLDTQQEYIKDSNGWREV